jgi:hypothetical protein
MSAKSILIDYLRPHTDLNMAVVRSLIDSAIEADVKEVTLNARPMYVEQNLTPATGEVWTEVNIAAMDRVVPDMPTPSAFTLVKEGIVFTPQIDPETFTISIQPDIAVADKTALGVHFTFAEPNSVVGYPAQSFIVTGAGGTGTLTSDVSTLDFSSGASLEVNMINKCAQADAADNFVVKSQKWTITLLDPLAE